MIVRKNNFLLDIDIESARAYSQSHSLCNCPECRNFYAQARKNLSKLAAFLDEMGISIEYPDKIDACAEGSKVDYHFTAYTLPGKILEYGGYEIDLPDGDLYLNIVINKEYIPNEQKTQDYFTISVYNISLPWILDEPFPKKIEIRPSLFSRIKKRFKK